MYEIGDFVVYGNEGVCVLENISEINIPGTNKSKNYYTLQLISNNGTIFTPMDTKVFMRPVITKEEINKLIEEIPSLEEIDCDTKNTKVLQEYYKNLLKSHNCRDLLTVILSISKKKDNLIKEGKRLGQVDDKFMKTAKNLIEDEFSVVLEISKKDVQSYIQNKINKIS